MLSYLVKRIFLFIPTLLVLSLVFFVLSKMASGDAFQNKIAISYKNTSSENILKRWESYNREKQQHNLLLPDFYISVFRRSSTDTLYRIADEKVRQSLINLSYNYGNWRLTDHYFTTIKQVLASAKYTPSEKDEIIALAREENLKKIKHIISGLSKDKFSPLTQSFNKLSHSEPDIFHFFPQLKWNGSRNQYHVWMKNLFNGSNTLTYSGGLLTEKISNSIFWTLLISLCSVFLSFTIGISAAFIAAKNENKAIDKIFTRLFFTLYSIPGFWFASMMILLFASAEVYNFFPSYGLGIIHEDATNREVFTIRLYHLILPVICISYGSIAYIFRQVRSSLLHEKIKDYYTTALSKGLSQSQAFRKHLFKNAVFPLITIIGKIIPAVFTGSFVIEYIFSIPGMGKLTIESFLARDYPLVFSIVMMVSFFSLVGLLLADFLYLLSDPRIRFSSKKSVS